MINNDLVHPAESCPLCSVADTDAFRPMASYRVDCETCGKFFVEGFIVADIRNMRDRHLLSGYTREWYETKGQRARIEAENLKVIPTQAPQMIAERAHKLLEAVARRSSHFGHVVDLVPEKDYPLAYAQNHEELAAFLHYLEEMGDVALSGSWQRRGVKITAAGFEALASRSLLPPLKVFISSTCYDLLDLRMELGQFLRDSGFAVQLSDVTESEFGVILTANSIQSCLQNVESADVIVCILDQRYGPKLPGREMSATQAEIQHARDLKKPIAIFIRNRAYTDYAFLRNNADANPLWVEKHETEECKTNRKRWLDFVKLLVRLPGEKQADYSNWVDQFETIVDLKRIVLKRLADHHLTLKR